MGALYQVVVKEFLQLRQDRRMIPAMIVGPLIQLLALGYAANLDVTNVRLLVVDSDRTAESRGLAERMTSAGRFVVVGSVETSEAVEPWLLDGRAQIALVIPSGFGSEIQAGRIPAFQALADGSDSNSAVVGLGYASRIVAEAIAEAVPAGRAAQGVGRIELAPRVLYNPDLRTRWFYVPAVLAMVLMLVTMLLPSMAVVREKEIGTLEQISVTPLRPWQLILGKLIPFVIIGLLDTLLVIFLSQSVLGVPFRGSVPLLLALTFLFLLNTLGLGLLVSTVVRTQQQAMMFSVFVLMVPMIYLSGLIFPVENMPALFQWGSWGIPVKYYAIILRGVFLKGSGLEILWPEALTLAAFGTFWIAVASSRFRKALD